jgi:hypothetical protein
MRQPFKTEEFSIAVRYRRLLGPNETAGLGSNRVDDGDRRLSTTPGWSFSIAIFGAATAIAYIKLASAGIGTRKSS